MSLRVNPWGTPCTSVIGFGGRYRWGEEGVFTFTSSQGIPGCALQPNRLSRAYTAPVRRPISSPRTRFPASWTWQSWRAGPSTRRTSVRWWPPRPDGCTWCSPTSRWSWATVPRTCACRRTRTERSWTDRPTCAPSCPARRTTTHLQRKSNWSYSFYKYVLFLKMLPPLPL